MKYKYLLASGVRSMGKALEYFRRAATQSGDPLVRAVAQERVFIRETMRVLFAPYCPPGKNLAPPAIRQEGLTQTLALLRPLSRMVQDAARVETPAIRVFDACYGYLLTYNIPASTGSQSPSPAPQTKQQANPPPPPYSYQGGTGVGTVSQRPRP